MIGANNYKIFAWSRSQFYETEARPPRLAQQGLGEPVRGDRSP